jgi:hypothetical protein
VIYESRAAFFWLEVDSADPGSRNLAAAAVGYGAAAAAGDGVLQLALPHEFALAAVQQGSSTVADSTAAPTAAAVTAHQVDAMKLADWQKQRKLVAGGAGGAMMPLPLPANNRHVLQHASHHPAVASGTEQQLAGLSAAAPAAARCPLQGLARIQQVLGKQISPAALAAHLGARHQQAAGCSSEEQQ